MSLLKYSSEIPTQGCTGVITYPMNTDTYIREKITGGNCSYAKLVMNIGIMIDAGKLILPVASPNINPTPTLRVSFDNDRLAIKLPIPEDSNTFMKKNIPSIRIVKFQGSISFIDSFRIFFLESIM